MSAFTSVFSPKRDPDGNRIDPEERFICLDGRPYFGSALGGMIYKNPQVTMGMALSFIAPTFYAADTKLDFLGITLSAVIASVAFATSTLLPYHIEKRDLSKRPELKGSVIDRHGLLANDQEKYKAAIKTYSGRIRLGGMLSGMSIFTCLPSIAFQNKGSLCFLLATGPAMALSAWSWWAKRKLENNDWTIINGVPLAMSALVRQPTRGRVSRKLTPASPAKG